MAAPHWRRRAPPQHFDVVVFTDWMPVKKLVELNEFCRNATRPKQEVQRDAEGREMRDSHGAEVHTQPLRHAARASSLTRTHTHNGA
jgi:hypothetical protein